MGKWYRFINGLALLLGLATDKEQVQETRDPVYESQCQFIGVVLNQAKIDAKDYQYIYYYSQDDSASS